MGPSIFRSMARVPQVATSQTLREVFQDDRASLGGDRFVLPSRKQGQSWNGRGTQYQNPRPPTTSVRISRRGLPETQNHCRLLTAAQPIPRKWPTVICVEPFL